MKVFTSILTLTAVMASTVSGCNSCNDCPGDQVCFFPASPGNAPSGACVEPNDPSCSSFEGFCDTNTCD
ncbi:hypothetical protein GGI42DRAFT_353991 [Trichoderma sp. SZMC 28013]